MGMIRLLKHRMGFLAAVLAIAAVFSAGCGGDGAQSGGSTTGRIELTYWPAPNPEEVQLADSLVRMWNRLHPEIHVTMQPIPVSQSTEEVLLAAIAGKTTPDVCSNIWPGALHDYTQAGGLIALDEFADFDSVITPRTPRALLETFRSGGHFYQVPWKTNPVMMYCNLDMFRSAGVTSLPRTYSEFLEAGRRISRDTTGDGEIDVWMGERDIRPIWWQRLFDFFPFYIAASGGKTLFADGRPAFENRNAEDVMTFFKHCYGRRLFPKTFYQGGDPFLLQVKATNFSGPWMVATIAKLAPNLKYEVVPLPVPADHAGPVYTYGDYKNIAIFSTTRYKREAWEFVKFLIRQESDAMLLDIAHQLPVRGDLKTNPAFADFFRRNPGMERFADQVPFTRGIDAMPDLKEIFDALSQEYEACAVYDRKTSQAAVRDAVRRAQLIVDWNK